MRQAVALLLAGLAVAHGSVLAQAPAPAPAVPAHCPAPADVQPGQLTGLWRAEFDGLPGATLLLEPHPHYAESLSGEVNRNGERSRLAADLEDGAFTLEESADGVHIAATWLGDVVAGSCGREIRGRWQPAGDKPAQGFVLRKLAS